MFYCIVPLRYNIIISRLTLIVQELSLKQRKLKTDKESNQNKEQWRELNIERNKTLKQLKKELRNDNDKQLDLELRDIEKYKDDPQQVLPSNQKNSVTQTTETSCNFLL